MSDQDQKQFVFGDDEGSSVVTVRHTGEFHDPDEGFPRPVYGYTITTEGWEYTNADIHGDQDEEPNLEAASQSLFAYLHNCVTQENDDFPANVRAWASKYTDEIADLAIESERKVTMAMIGGNLVESDEDSTEF